MLFSIFSQVRLSVFVKPLDNDFYILFSPNEWATYLHFLHSGYIYAVHPHVLNAWIIGVSCIDASEGTLILGWFPYQPHCISEPLATLHFARPSYHHVINNWNHIHGALKSRTPLGVCVPQVKNAWFWLSSPEKYWKIWKSQCFFLQNWCQL